MSTTSSIWDNVSMFYTQGGVLLNTSTDSSSLPSWARAVSSTKSSASFCTATSTSVLTELQNVFPSHMTCASGYSPWRYSFVWCGKTSGAGTRSVDLSASWLLSLAANDAHQKHLTMVTRMSSNLLFLNSLNFPYSHWLLQPRFPDHWRSRKTLANDIEPSDNQQKTIYWNCKSCIKTNLLFLFVRVVFFLKKVQLFSCSW